MTERLIRKIIIHCSASPNGRPLSTATRTAAQVIDDWHRERAFRRGELMRAQYNPHLTSVGYHTIIDVDGAVYSGRHPDEVGAHAAGHNADSLGVCLVGTDAFTPAQWAALRRTVEAQRAMRPNLQTLGHRDLPDVHKTCPGFDVAEWERFGRQPMPGHIQETAS